MGFVRAQAENPGLGPGQIDLVLIINVSHFVANKAPASNRLEIAPAIATCLRRLRESLRPGGRILVYHELGSKWDLRTSSPVRRDLDARFHVQPLVAAGFRVLKQGELDIGGGRFYRILGKP